MITSLHLKDFKNFQNAKIKLGPVTTLVGANGSGKSNLCDAFRFLHGIGRGYTLAQIFGGALGVGGEKVWEGIRGGAVGCARHGQEGFAIKLETLHESGSDETLVYEINVLTPKAPHEPTVRQEQLLMEEEEVYAAKKESLQDVQFSLSLAGLPDGNWDIDDKSPALYDAWKLSQNVEEEDPSGVIDLNEAGYLLGSLESLKSCLGEIRFLDLVPDQLRKPCAPGQSVLGARGENLSGVLQSLLKEEKNSQVLLSWIDSLLPHEIAGIEVVPVSPSTVQIALHEPGGNMVDGDRVSDGTLRFLGFLVALMTADPGELLFLEEVENGIHPSRLHLLIELIESQAQHRGIQVILTTHSSTLLDFLNKQSREHVYLIYRDRENSSGMVQQVMALPEAGNIIEKQGLGKLHASHWMEDSTLFSLPDPEGE
ncbi:MAG: AAA family ATPase [Candidatus Sumerlaeia bacterium]|nr:AAA family ATPase [Candidatus Sumerlaeia bacterium]